MDQGLTEDASGIGALQTGSMSGKFVSPQMDRVFLSVRPEIEVKPGNVVFRGVGVGDLPSHGYADIHTFTGTGLTKKLHHGGVLLNLPICRLKLIL